MPIPRAISTFWRNLAHRGSVDRELDDELWNYRELLVAEKVAAGMPPDVARRAAQIEMGGVTQLKEQVRSVRRGALLRGFSSDLRFALRQMARAPVFTAVAVVLLGLGIGLDAALLTIVQALVARPAPGLGDTEGLVWIRARYTAPNGARRDRSMTYSALLAYRDQTATFSSVAASTGAGSSLLVDAGPGPSQSRAEFVSGGYFPALRLPMTLGSGFAFPDEAALGPIAVAVVSHDFWQRRLGSDPGVVGREIRISAGRDYMGRLPSTVEIPVTIVGVAPERFNGLRYDMEAGRDIWLPLGLHTLLHPPTPDARARGEREWLTLAARLHPSASVERANSVVSVLGARLATDAERKRTATTVNAERLGAWEQPGSVAASLGLATTVMAIAAIFLLITCTNVSSMLLGRAVARRHEIGVRLSLGASRWRIVRQLLTESVVLALLAGAIAGVVLFSLLDAVGKLVFLVPPDLSPDWSIAGFAAAISLVAGVVFGLVPALHATRASVSDVLKAGAPTAGARRSLWQAGFVVIQLAVSFPLLFGAAAIVISLHTWLYRPLGYDASTNVLTARVESGLSDATSRGLEPTLEAAKQRIAETPGVLSVALTSALPPGESDASSYMNGRRGGGFSRPDDELGLLGGRVLENSVAWVDPDYFAAIGLALRRGRGIAASDVAGTDFVAVVSEDFARLVWPGEDPLGKTLVRGRRGPQRDGTEVRDTTFTVVGVAGAVRGSGEEEPVVYVARRQRAGGAVPAPGAGSAPGTVLVVRVAASVAGIPTAIRRELNHLDPTLTVSPIESLAERRARSIEGLAKGLWAALASGLLMLLLSSVGIYALVAFGVSQRTREIGVRMALGARTSQVVGMFMKRASLIATIGLIAGIPLIVAVMKLGPGDVGGFSMFRLYTVIGISLVLLAVTGVAGWIPARRAARVNPADALRSD